MRYKNIMKVLLIIIIIFLVFILGGIIYKRYKYVTYIGKIIDIENYGLTVNCYEEEYECPIKDAQILNSKGKKINIGDLKVGDSIAIVMDRDSTVALTIPPVLSNIRKIIIINSK